jgi:hypothetical protein
VFCQNTIDLQNDNQICCYLRIYHLICVAWSLRQRRRYDDEIYQDAATMFTSCRNVERKKAKMISKISEENSKEEQNCWFISTMMIRFNSNILYECSLLIEWCTRFYSIYDLMIYK